MSLAYANKDQMKVWKSTSKPDKDFPARSTENVMLEVKQAKDGKGYVAMLSASDGYQLMKRNIQIDDDAAAEAPLKQVIPRDAMEKAEKAMKKNDRAHFSNNKITIYEVTFDEHDEEQARITAIVPYATQMDMFIDMESAIQKEANKEHPEKVVKIDAKKLRQIADQLKNGDAITNVTIRFRGEKDGMIITAFEGIEDEEITAVIMPITI